MPSSAWRPRRRARCCCSAPGPAWPPARPTATPRVVVPQGIGAAALKGAKVTGKAAAAGTERVSFVLRVTHPAALAARVNGSGKALSVSQFAAGFGQPGARPSASWPAS